MVTKTVRMAADAVRTDNSRPESDSGDIMWGNRNNMDPAFAVDCLLHVTLLFTVLTFFFQLFISKVEEKAFKSEFAKLVNTSIANNATLKRAMGSIVGKHVAKSKNVQALHRLYSEPDDFVQANNTWLFRSSLIASAGMVAVIAAISWASAGRVPLTELVGHNVAAFALVGVVEYFFFTRVAMKFQPAAPSVLVTSAISKAKEMVDA